MPRAKPPRRPAVADGAEADGAADPRAACLLGCHVLVPGAPVPTSPRPPGSRLRMVRGNRKHVRIAGDEDGDWPATTDQWCWYCCHPFESPPLPMPLKYDNKLDLFHVMGTFCSWPCIKAFNGDSSSYMKSVVATYITLFHWRCTGAPRGIRSAPPRQALRVFGGALSIQQFRDASNHDVDYCILPPKMVLHHHVVHEQQHASRRVAAAQAAKRPPVDLAQVVSFRDVGTKNETLRLKRPKPLQNNRNLLERTMGINALIKSRENHARTSWEARYQDRVYGSVTTVSCLPAG